jgi:hypothetical protein
MFFYLLNYFLKMLEMIDEFAHSMRSAMKS